MVVRDDRFLVIRRSAYVRAPGMLCFPGGGVESGETLVDALRRELREELSVDVKPVEQVWDCVTDWGVHLSWWRAELVDDAEFRPDRSEVAGWFWLTAAEIRTAPQVLSSNLRFLDYWESRL